MKKTISKLNEALCRSNRRVWICALVTALLPVLARAQGDYATEGIEYNIAGQLSGDQTYPQASIKTSGGYIVWQDNITDGSGLGISARKLDSSLSSPFSVFRVNANGADDQDRPAVSMLNDGGAAFVWRGGRQGFQHIYARFLSAGGTWVTGDVPVNTSTNKFQVEPVVTTLANSNAVVAWSSFNQVSSNSMRDVYFQILSPAGVKVGGETRVNFATAFNQRSPSIAPLSDGRYVVVWVSEQQRFLNSVDIYGCIFNANGSAATGEFLINTGTNVCANPSVARSPDGGFAVAWSQKDVAIRTNSWDIFARPFSGSAVGGTVTRVNGTLFGDQYVPSIAAVGTDYLIIWTSLGQDGSREGVFGRFVRGNGTLLGSELRVNGTTVSQQMHPCLASDGIARFLAVWTSFVGGDASFDLYAQRYVSTSEPLPAPGAPFISVLSSNALSLTWPPVQGFNIASYEIYADGAIVNPVVTTNIYWTATGLAPASAHTYRLAYVLGDGRRSPLSAPASGTTYSGGAAWGGIPQDWMIAYFGGDIFQWPAPNSDLDGDGATLLQEFLTGTDPTNSASVLRQRLVQTAQGPFLNWNTQPGLVYQVQIAPNLGVWQNLGQPRFAAGYVDSVYVGGYSSSLFRIKRLR